MLADLALGHAAAGAPGGAGSPVVTAAVAAEAGAVYALLQVRLHCIERGTRLGSLAIGTCVCSVAPPTSPHLSHKWLKAHASRPLAVADRNRWLATCRRPAPPALCARTRSARPLWPRRSPATPWSRHCSAPPLSAAVTWAQARRAPRRAPPAAARRCVAQGCSCCAPGRSSSARRRARWSMRWR